MLTKVCRDFKTQSLFVWKLMCRLFISYSNKGNVPKKKPAYATARRLIQKFTGNVSTDSTYLA